MVTISRDNLVRKINKFPRKERSDDSVTLNEARTQRGRRAKRVTASEQPRSDTVDPLTLRYLRRVFMPGWQLATQLQADFDNALDDSEAIEDGLELDETGQPEDSGHFIHHER